MRGRMAARLAAPTWEPTSRLTGWAGWPEEGGCHRALRMETTSSVLWLGPQVIGDSAVLSQLPVGMVTRDGATPSRPGMRQLELAVASTVVPDCAVATTGMQVSVPGRLQSIACARVGGASVVPVMTMVVSSAIRCGWQYRRIDLKSAPAGML